MKTARIVTGFRTALLKLCARIRLFRPLTSQLLHPPEGSSSIHPPCSVPPAEIPAPVRKPSTFTSKRSIRRIRRIRCIRRLQLLRRFPLRRFRLRLRVLLRTSSLRHWLRHPQRLRHPPLIYRGGLERSHRRRIRTSFPKSFRRHPITGIEDQICSTISGRCTIRRLLRHQRLHLLRLFRRVGPALRPS